MEIDYENLFCIEDMKEEDLGQVISIRNHPDVICRLHTPVGFTLEQSKRWFNKENPIWFCIKEISTKNVVGYFRTSNINYDSKDMYIGCDIHPDFQQKGIASWGYKKIFKTLADIGWKSLSLKVLKNNIIAKNLYIKLGFEDNGEDDSSFFMKKNIGCDQVERNVKVLSVYLGNRRRGFFKPYHMLKMLEFLWGRELEVDNGVPTDTVLIYNKLSEEELCKIEDIENYEKSEKFLYGLNCKKTKNGHCFVVERENIGISYGAFDYAFDLFKDDYKYWLFIEDDHIVIKDNMMKKCIQQLMNPSLNNPCGFVAVVAISGGTEECPLYAHGGCGCSSKNILNKVVNNNYSKTLNRGFLPHLRDKPSSPIHILFDYDKDSGWEKGFTNSIFQLGYGMEDLHMENNVVTWGNECDLNYHLAPHSSVPSINIQLDIDITLDYDAKKQLPIFWIFPAKKCENKILDVIFRDSLTNNIVHEGQVDTGDLRRDIKFFIIAPIDSEKHKNIVVEFFNSGELIKSFNLLTPSLEEYRPLKGGEILPALRNVNVHVDFINAPFIEITGGDYDGYYECDMIDNSNGEIVYSVKIKKNYWAKSTRQWFTNWKINIYKKGHLVYSCDSDPMGRKTLISFDSKSLGDNIAWMPYVEEFRKKYNCKVVLSTFWNYLFEKEYPEIEFVNPGTVVNNIQGKYSIGWYIPWDSDKNPNDFRTIPLQQTASDILGLDYKEIKPKIAIPDTPRVIKEKYICIGMHSTAQAKYWNYPDGWQKITDYLANKNYKTVMIHKEQGVYMGNYPPHGVIDKTGDYPIEERIVDLKHAEAFIGVGSGLSWLSWAVGTPTVLISGFSAPFCEPTEGIERIHNPNVCHSCFNDQDIQFDSGDWNWCPRNKDFKCSKKILPEDVFKAIDNIIEKRK